MKHLNFLLKQAFFVSLVMLFLSQTFESIFPGLVKQSVSFDSLLFLAMLLGVAWGLVSWHLSHFQPKSQAKI